jgi:hypothetical protein
VDDHVRAPPVVLFSRIITTLACRVTDGEQGMWTYVTVFASLQDQVSVLFFSFRDGTRYNISTLPQYHHHGFTDWRSYFSVLRDSWAQGFVSFELRSTLSNLKLHVGHEGYFLSFAVVLQSIHHEQTWCIRLGRITFELRPADVAKNMQRLLFALAEHHEDTGFWLRF